MDHRRLGPQRGREVNIACGLSLASCFTASCFLFLASCNPSQLATCYPLYCYPSLTMNSIFCLSLFRPAKAVDAQSVFHGDQSLRDQRPVTRSWLNSESLRSDLPAGLRLLRARLQGVQDEEAVAQCAALPVDDPLRKVLTAKSVHRLWGSLLHPPLSYRGGLFEYRTADGSANVRIF